MPEYLKPEDDGLPMRESGEWAAEKLDYLARYIDIFQLAMKGKWPLRNYIDLMAGPGKNIIRETGQVLLGSPMLALNTRHPFTGYFFSEASSEHCSALSARCSASPLTSKTKIWNGDCNLLVKEIVGNLRADGDRSLNLAFLDPEGFELKWQTVVQLAQIKRLDLIINYPQGGLNRFMPRVVDSVEDNQIDAFFGDRQWRAIYSDSRDHPGLHRRLIDLYKSNLESLGYRQIRQDDQVGDEPLMRNAARNAPLYRLLFASKHQLGDDFWKKITRRDLHGQKRMF